MMVVICQRFDRSAWEHVGRDDEDGLEASRLRCQCRHLGGIDIVRGEWNLVTIAGNMKRMFVLANAN